VRDVAAALATALPGSDLITDPDVLAALSHDEAEWAAIGAPMVALRARSTDEVRAAVAACAELRGSSRVAPAPAFQAARTPWTAVYYWT
jgi:FAD/FMN-containing dehydrogenase